MKSSGLADSPLFPMPQSQPITVTPPASPSSRPPAPDTPASCTRPQLATPRSKGDTTTPRPRDTAPSRYHDITIEALREAVGQIGKEATTHRFTTEEKKALAEIVYTHKNRGMATSENEVIRIALNFILDDYRENRGDSILEKVLTALTR